MNIGVHKAHCCNKHGCKYGDSGCPVKSGNVSQDYPCEYCYDETQEENELSSLRALLAQRDGELEALRKVVRYAFNAAEGQKTDIDRYGFDDSSDETVIVIYTLLAAALSDNPESPALTDKE